jgi:hypothetical protein
MRYNGEEMTIVQYDLKAEKVVLLTQEYQEVLVDEEELPEHTDEIEEAKARARIAEIIEPFDAETTTRILQVLINAEY